MTAEAIPVIDAHVHCFDLARRGLGYDWLQPGAPPDPDLGDYSAIKSARYWPEDFEAETRFNGLIGAVHVEVSGAADPVAETRWVAAHATASGLPQGLIAHADLARPDAPAVIEAQLAAGPVRGIRDLREDDFLDSAAWRSGYGHLARHQLVCCAHPPLEAAPGTVSLAREHPSVTLCLDHFCYPLRRDPEYFGFWRTAMARLAACDNVVIKLSGLGMNDHRWTTASIRPWITAAIELFGPARCFFASNWPIDRLYSSYTDLISAFRECISDLSRSEKEAILFGNAMRIFRLPEPDRYYQRTEGQADEDLLRQ
jgi:predicted TIM-barrel fold metal-dependent hydrolase